MTKVVLSKVTVSRSQQRYLASTKNLVTLSVSVAGASSGVVDFRSGAVVVASAVIKAGKASVTLSRTQKVGVYKGVSAYYGGDATHQAAVLTSTRSFKVVKNAVAKRARVTGKRTYRAGGKVVVKVKVGKLKDGTWATGKVRVYVGGKAAKTVTLAAKKKGTVSVTLKKQRATSVKVKAKYLPKAPSGVKSSTTKAVRFRAR